MKCPIHQEESLREERSIKNERTGFCTLCLKHYLLCNAIQFMSICQKLADHSGDHMKNDGDVF